MNAIQVTVFHRHLEDARRRRGSLGPNQLQCGYRDYSATLNRLRTHGFRVAKSVEP